MGGCSTELLDESTVLSAKWLSSGIFFTIAILKFASSKSDICGQLTKVFSATEMNHLSIKTDWSSGIKYGLICVRACAPLTVTMFVFGLMNIVAMIGLTCLMFIEANVSRVQFKKNLVGGLAFGVGFLYFF